MLHKWRWNSLLLFNCRFKIYSTMFRAKEWSSQNLDFNPDISLGINQICWCCILRYRRLPFRRKLCRKHLTSKQNSWVYRPIHYINYQHLSFRTSRIRDSGSGQIKYKKRVIVILVMLSFVNQSILWHRSAINIAWTNLWSRRF